MNDILEYNKYINIFNSIYNYISTTKDKDISELEIEPAKGFKKFKKNKQKECTIRYQIISKEVKKMLNEFIDEECKMEDMLAFASLWQFCQFIRYAEKTIFYENTPEQSFYVDSDMFDIKERAFQIKYHDNVEILFKLEKVSDEITKQDFKVITLNVNRLYGKKMSNIFKIVDEDVKTNDTSDIYLIDMVNDILYKEMKISLEYIIYGQLMRAHGFMRIYE